MKHDHDANPYQKYDDLFDAQNAKEVTAGKKEKAKEKKQADDRQASFDRPTRPIAGNDEPKDTTRKRNFTPLIAIGIFYVILQTVFVDSMSSDAIRAVGFMFIIVFGLYTFLAKKR